MTDRHDVTIIHGCGGTPDGNWFPWLKGELEARGCAVRVPLFPRPEAQNLSSWMECFDAHTKTIGTETILIGHSSGVALILNVLNRLKTPIAGTFLVGGFVGKIGSTTYDPINASFFDDEFDWLRIRKNAGELFIYAGDNDPYVPMDKSVELASLLKSELIVIPGGGHLNYECNFLRFDRLIRDYDWWKAGTGTLDNPRTKVPSAASSDVLDAILDSWDRNNAVLVNLLHALPEGGLTAKAAEGSPAVSEMFMHMYHERMVSVSEEVPELQSKVPAIEWEFEPDLNLIAERLIESADLVRNAVKSRVEAGRAMDLNFAHPIHLIQFLIFHEGYHHGQIKIALKVAGRPIGNDVAGPLTWDVWRKRDLK